MSVRAGIVVTGTEVLTGRVSDLNGPWMAEQLRRRGVDVGQVVIVGDRPEDLHAALTFLAGRNELLITSGGLGPTADDLTAAVVAEHQGRALRLDEALERRVAAIIAALMARRGVEHSPVATAAGARKQALVPDGALVLDPVGTAPGLVVPVADGRTGPPVVVLPGPPGELQGMWPQVWRAAPVAAVVASAEPLHQSTIRMYGPAEADLAQSLRRIENELTGLEVTTCLREGELEVVSRYPPAAEAGQRLLRQTLLADFGTSVYSPDGQAVDELVHERLRRLALTLAVAESCTGGLLAARLTRLPGSSAFFAGGLNLYSDSAKVSLAGVSPDLIAQHGAVSPPVATAMADGARAAFAADLAVAVSGVAGPGGGTAAKPVGTVVLAVTGEQVREVRVLTLGGSRETIRQRSTVAALHLLREALQRSA